MALSSAAAHRRHPANYGILQGKLHMLPSGPFSLFTTGLLTTFAAKREAARLFATFGKIDASSLKNLEMIIENQTRGERRVVLEMIEMD